MLRAITALIDRQSEAGKMKVTLLCLCLLLSLQKYLCVNILAITMLTSPSHYIWHRSYLLNLVKNGHNITVLGLDEEKERIDNFTMLTVEGIYEKIKDTIVREDLISYGPLQAIKLIWDWDVMVCKHSLETSAMAALLNYPEDFKFDLIIWDVNAGRCLYPLIKRFGSPPVIGTSPFGLQPHMGYMMGNHIYSYIPFFQVSASDKMGFLDRIRNFVYVHAKNLSRKYYSMPKEYEIAKAFFGSEIRSFDEDERNITLFLANTDPVLHYVESLPANIIPVGGIHIEPVQELSKDLKAILDKAEHGVIYVAFGTNLNFENFGDKQRVAFFEAFGKLSQTILIKSPKKDPNLPSNVITRNWLPQNDVLAHPNVKLFISHGGALSTQEAMYHGVPVVGMPFYFDQHGNMGKITEKKLGKTIRYYEATSNLVYNTISEVLNNPLYRTNMQILSKRYKDQPQSPMERALFWTEYVLRHGSAEHLSPATRDMLIFQRFDLDIFAVFLGILILISYLLYLITKIFCKMLPLRNSKISNKLKTS